MVHIFFFFFKFFPGGPPESTSDGDFEKMRPRGPYCGHCSVSRAVRGLSRAILRYITHLGALWRALRVTHITIFSMNGASSIHQKNGSTKRHFSTPCQFTSPRVIIPLWYDGVKT